PEPAANLNLITPEIENAPTSVWLPMRHGDRHALLPVDASNRLLYYSCREEWIANDIRDGKNYGWLPGWTLHDPMTGKVLIAIYSGNDYDGGTAGNFDPRYESVEVYTGRGNAYNASTLQPLAYALNTNAHAFWWDGDLNHELIDTTVVRKFNPATNSLVAVFQPSGVSSGAGKNMPQLQADLFGDWREEYIVRYGNTALRVFTTVTPTEYGIRTLMHDPLYRNDVALQNSTYNMSPHTSFFLGPNSPLPPKRSDIEVTLSGIISEVIGPEPLTVLYGTGWSALNLPEQVWVRVDTGAYRLVGVEWENADYDPLSAAAQVIRGRLMLTDRLFNPYGLGARVQVNVVYGFGGVLPPLEADRATLFTSGSTVPIRFRLVDAHGASVAGAEVRIFIARVSDGQPEQFSEAVSTVPRQGNVARYDTEEALYIFNLSTRGLTLGTYRILIDPGDGTQHVVGISLR
ncbi:MAG: PxKF domain-containing protein, partial [Anaerolineae bacterium]|nr:PxKF domain-containing protein [Anaerolineae bacterium]